MLYQQLPQFHRYYDYMRTLFVTKKLHSSTEELKV